MKLLLWGEGIFKKLAGNFLNMIISYCNNIKPPIQYISLYIYYLWINFKFIRNLGIWWMVVWG